MGSTMIGHRPCNGSSYNVSTASYSSFASRGRGRGLCGATTPCSRLAQSEPGTSTKLAELISRLPRLRQDRQSHLQVFHAPLRHLDQRSFKPSDPFDI